MNTLRSLRHVAVLSFLVSPLFGEVTVEEVKQEVLKELRKEAPITNASRTSASAFNPAMGLTLDAVASHTTENRGQFEFRSAEVSLSADVDPFARLYAVLNGNEDGVEVEEAFFMTTSLPGNLTVRGGRLFANFGRLPHWHDHELPFVNRTDSLDTFIGGEAQGDGLEVMHLFKTPFFLQGTLGAYSKLGGDNTRLEETGGDGHTRGRPGDAFTYLARLVTYIPLGDDHGLDLGISQALTPKQYYIEGVRQDHRHSARSLTGVDLTFRFEPTSDNVFRKLLWGTEIFRNEEVRGFDTDADSVADSFDRKRAWGGYSYVDWRFARRWSTGGFFDFAEDLNAPDLNTRTVGALLNFIPSEFQRIRLQLSRKKANDGSSADNQVFVQWFLTIGTHVHVFKDR